MFRSDFLTFMSSVFDSISSVARLALATPHPVTCIPYFKGHFHFPRLESFVLKPLETFFKPVPYTKGKSKKLKKRDFSDMLREIIVGQNILELSQFPALKSLQIVTDEDIGDNAPDASVSQESYEWLESVQELTLLGKWHRAFPCAQDLLKSCINLRRLSFGSSHVEDVPNLLDTLKSDPALFPCLSTLVLHNPTFDPDDRSNDGELDDDSNIFEDDEESRRKTKMRLALAPTATNQKSSSSTSARW
ncbi:unnamed protein product [Cyclocybe aegerita]|uniref:Uncharacterized protein n=1 Tax=Cyclocybe aegerita TaxID=1973307 RepID=A0A8S0VVW7_CYCAE|nr:unnamed protein product [Cyclocybe aegerita]